MKLRVAKRVSLGRSCGFHCHNWRTIKHALWVFARAMRRGSRLTPREFPEQFYWSKEDRNACGLAEVRTEARSLDID